MGLSVRTKWKAALCDRARNIGARADVDRERRDRASRCALLLKCAACDALVDAREVLPRLRRELCRSARRCPRCGLPFAGGVVTCARPARRTLRSGARRISTRLSVARIVRRAPDRRACSDDARRRRCDVVIGGAARPPPPRQRSTIRRCCSPAPPGRACASTLSLRRVRDTPPQAGLSTGARRASVRRCVRRDPPAHRGPFASRGRRCLTTGATVEACARASHRRRHEIW